jgi:hypothetical protein
MQPRLEISMNRDPRIALSQELEAKQTLLDQLRALAAEDPDFFTDLIEGETNLLELIAALDWTNSRRANAAPRTASSSSADSPAHTLQQIGLTLRTPTSTLTLAEASLKAIPIAKTSRRAGGNRSPQTRSGRPHQGKPTT